MEAKATTDTKSAQTAVLEHPTEATRSTGEGEGWKGDQGDQESHASAVSAPDRPWLFRKGYDPRRLDPLVALEHARANPRGPSLLTRLKGRLANRPEELDELVNALLLVAKNADQPKGLVEAHRVLLDRLDGPVVRETRTESVQARVVVSAPGVALPPPRDARATAIGPGGPEEAVQRAVGALPGGPALLGAPATSHGDVATFGSHATSGASTVDLEGRVARVEAAVDRIASMMEMLVKLQGVPAMSQVAVGVVPVAPVLPGGSP